MLFVCHEELVAAPSSQVVPQTLEQWLALPREERPPLTNCDFAQVPLDRAGAAASLTALWADRQAFIRTNRAAEMQAREIQLDGRKMKFAWLTFGDTNAVPPGGHSLFLSLHGGGNAPTEVNDSQWTNQLRLGKAYQPAEGLYVAPRAPTDDWDLWHQACIDDFFARLIEELVVFEHVNPNRVYVMGYSAGGDGVYQLAPRTPDRWAAAAMMAGHPNEAQPLGLRNVPFALQVGAEDAGYHRNTVAAEWGRQLDALHQADPDGYIHFTKLHAGKGHWMGLLDRPAVPWMEQFTRNPLPSRVVWFQDDVLHDRCYWLARPKSEVKLGQLLSAERAGQVIALASTNVTTVTVLLNDVLLNLDQPVVICGGGQVLYSNRVTRSIACLAQTLEARGDPELAFSAAVTVTLPPAWWSPDTELTLHAAGTNAAALIQALQNAPLAQRPGLQYLIENLPAPDAANLPADLLLTNVALAYQALSEAPWGSQIPVDIFNEGILPYAAINEPRDDWRGRLRALAQPLVAACRTPGEAALTLNRQWFDLVKVHYSTERARADQSPLESMQSGKASCTGLSVLLVDACRAVGIPARVAGIPDWVNDRGNHTWVEIWDNGWHFIGAGEPDAAGLDHAWFAADAAQAKKDEPQRAIYAVSYRRTGLAFPLSWAPEISWVNAVNVTDRYTVTNPPATNTIRLQIKVVNAQGQRVAVPVTVASATNPDLKFTGLSSDESGDLNRFFSCDWPTNLPAEIQVGTGSQLQRKTVSPQSSGEQLIVIQLSSEATQ